MFSLLAQICYSTRDSSRLVTMTDDFGMSEQELQQMYQEVILDASKHPHGKVELNGGYDSAASRLASGENTVSIGHESCMIGQSQQFNPTCGDTATVRVEVSDASDDKPNRIDRIIWEGDGCSISQASLSIMIDLVQGRSVDDAMKLASSFQKLMQSRGAGLDDEDLNDALGDAIAFQGVSQYPMRIKCALLGWEGMKAAVAQAVTVSENKHSTVFSHA